MRDKELILVVDDEQHIIELLKYNLLHEGFRVIYSDNGEDAVKLCNTEHPDLVILDIMLPGIDGLEVCKILKSQCNTRLIPIIMLTAKSEEFDKVLGLELGADDYVSKPFGIRELIARVKALLRRTDLSSQGHSTDIIQIDDITINCLTYEVTKENHKIDLSLKEFELLKLLAANKGQVLTRDFILDKLWGYEYYGDTRTVDVHIRYLRKKLGDDNRYIETVRGVGYKFRFGE